MLHSCCSCCSYLLNLALHGNGCSATLICWFLLMASSLSVKEVETLSSRQHNQMRVNPEATGSNHLISNDQLAWLYPEPFLTGGKQCVGTKRSRRRSGRSASLANTKVPNTKLCIGGTKQSSDERALHGTQVVGIFIFTDTTRGFWPYY